MRIFVYKVLILFLSLFFLYQFTIGYSLYKLQQNIFSNLNKETAVSIKMKIREEIKAGLNKDRILNKEDATLLRDLFNKIKLELNTYN
jgi:hypothetical protein